MSDLDILGAYLREIGPFPVLTSSQEAALVHRLRAGSDEAKTILISSNLKLVVHIAKQFTNSGLELQDLIQEGNFGLVEAANEYARKEGTTFKSYADDCIRNQIISAIRKKPRHQALSFDMDDGLAENTPDRLSPDPAEEANSIETTQEVAHVLQLLPTQKAVSKIANGYHLSELTKEQHKEYAVSLRLLSHPARSNQLNQL